MAGIEAGTSDCLAGAESIKPHKLFAECRHTSRSFLCAHPKLTCDTLRFSSHTLSNQRLCTRGGTRTRNLLLRGGGALSIRPHELLCCTKSCTILERWLDSLQLTRTRWSVLPHPASQRVPHAMAGIKAATPDCAAAAESIKPHKLSAECRHTSRSCLCTYPS